MKRTPQYIAVLVALGLLPASGAHADIEFIYIVKEKAYQQIGNTAPESPFEWSFGAGVSGGMDVQGGSVDYPGGSQVFSGSDGEYETPDQIFESQELLDATFPNGNFSLIITVNGAGQSFGPFTIDGDTYPPAPHYQNAIALQTHDFSQDFTLIWNAFSGSGEGDQILFQIWDPNTVNEVLFEFLEPTATSYLIPGGTLTTGTSYDFDILFVNETAGLESPETIIGYLSGTTFNLPGSSNDTTLAFYKWKRNLQTSPGVIEDNGYRPLAVVTGVTNSVTAAQIITPSGSFNIPNTASNSFNLIAPFGAKETLDINYPAGDYTFALTENGSPVNYGPYPLPGDAYPDPPLIQNFNELQIFDATRNQIITWDAPPQGLNVIRLVILNEFGIQAWDENLPPSSTSTQIPANILETDKNYSIVVRFQSQQTGGENPRAILGYINSTRMFVQTSSGSGSAGANLRFYKSERFLQTGPAIVIDDGYRAISLVTGNTNSVTSAKINTPAGPYNLIENAPDSFVWNSPISTRAILDTNYPAGDYSFGLTENGLPANYGPYALIEADYPAAPLFQNFSELQNFDPTQSQTAFWDSAPGGVSEIRILVLDAGLSRIWSENLGAAIVSTQVPANTLLIDQEYTLVIQFWGEQSGSMNPTTSLGYMAQTRMSVQTSPGVGDPGIDFIYAIKEKAHTQSSNEAPNAVREWTFGAGVSGGANVTGGSVSFSGGTKVFTGSFGEYETPGQVFESQEHLDAAFPNGGFTLNVTVDGSSEEFGPFTISGDAYPPAPHMLNVAELQAHDFNQDFVLLWNEFTGSDENDRLILQIWDADFDQQIIFEFLPSTDTMFLIPRGTFSLNKRYDIGLYFINQTDGLDTPDSIIGYLSDTRFSLSTWNYSMWLSQHFMEEDLLNAEIVGENADPDGDGLSNLFEFLARLDPLDRNSKLNYIYSKYPKESLRIGPFNWSVNYQIFSSPDLEIWSPLGLGSYEMIANELEIDLQSLLPSTFFKVYFSDGEL